jgi:hypothetical protein
MSHTPGPWRVGQCWAESYGDAYIIGGEKHEEREANTRLIAAAPDLLEACHAFCQTMAFVDPLNIKEAINAAYNAARAAIEKAEKPLAT